MSKDQESRIMELKDKMNRANETFQADKLKQTSINEQLQEQKTVQSQQIEHLQQ